MKIKNKIKIILFLFLVPNASALQITEIMYNPEGSDNNREYIEIYSEEKLNLTNFTIKDSNSEDNLELLRNGNNYYLIVEENFNYSNLNATVYSAGAAIGNGLNNNEDIIILLENLTIKETVHYFSEWGGDSNNMSICVINNTWKECISTPGYQNKIPQNSEEYSLIISEFLPNPVGLDSAQAPEGEWIEIFNNGSQVIDLEEFILRDEKRNEIIITETNTKLEINPGEYSIIYMNGEWGFLNNNGFEKIEILDKDYNIIDSVSYEGSEEGLSWSLIDSFWNLVIPTPKEKNSDQEIKKESTIEIENIYLGTDNKAKFGDNIRVRIKLYKGDTTKEEIKVYLEKEGEKITKVTKFKIFDKFSENILTIPLQILPNCNSKFPNEYYNLHIEGIGTSIEEEIYLEGNSGELCETILETRVETLEEQPKKVINYSSSTFNERLYASTSKKSEGSAIYLFCLILIMIILHLGIEKWKK